MNIQLAKSMEHLAKFCNEALGVITERECPDCNGSGGMDDGRLDGAGICEDCNGTGKVGWKWEPEVNQTVLYDKKLMFIVSVGETRLSLLPFGIPYLGESLDDYVYAPEIIDVIPIPPWEEIEGVLERAGYYITLERPDRNLLHRSSIPWCAEVRLPTKGKNYDIIRGDGESLQEAVMRMVKALASKLKEK